MDLIVDGETISCDDDFKRLYLARGMTMFKSGLFLFVAMWVSWSAFSMVQVYPTRVIFDDKERTTTISIRNRSTIEESYTLKAVFFRMSPNGTMEMVDTTKKEERSLVDYVRFSPRRITLKPNEEQVVRLMLKNTAPLDMGDYRAHLRILPDDAPVALQAPQDDKASLQLIGKVAVSISMFYYKGTVKLESALSNFKIEKDAAKPGQYKFSVTILNRGTSFLIGSFQIFNVASDGKEKKVGFLDGIYSYVAERSVDYSFSPVDNASIPSGKVRLKFFSPAYLGETLLASIDTTL